MKSIAELTAEIVAICEREKLWIDQERPEKGELELILDAVQALRTMPICLPLNSERAQAADSLYLS